jgi:CubicO group peptidase (beta-lactamase class C family)
MFITKAKLKKKYPMVSVALFIVMGFGLLLPAASGYATPSELSDRQALEAFMDGLMSEQMAEHNIPGATLSVVKDGEVLLVKGYGHVDLDSRTPVDGKQSLFRVGSVSKLITWTAVMQLVEQGKVDLDADINTYLDFEIPDRIYKSRGADPHPVTMRHLLTHTPGFEDVLEGLFVLSPDKMNPLGDHLRKYRPARVYPAGEVLAYSNYGSALAGYIVEMVSGQPFSDYVEENIFQPLGMYHSTFLQPLPEKLAPQMVLAYKFAGDEYHEGGFEYIPLYPAGSMSSSAGDMARFMIAHLQEGRYEGHQILKAETTREMHRQQFTQHPQVMGATFGYFEDEINGQKLITHNGATMLFFSHLYLLPEHSLGFFVSYSGGDQMQSMALFQDLMDRYYPHPYTEELPEPPVDARERAADYLGEYHPTRISFTTSDRFIGLLQALQIRMDAEGYLVANFMGEPLRFVEVERGVYLNTDPQQASFLDTVAFATGPEGRPMLTAGAATFIKAPWYGTLYFNGGLLGFAFLLIIVTLAGWTMASLWRLFRRKKRETSGGARIARGIVVAFSLLTIAFLAGMIYIFTDIDPAYGVPGIVFGIITPVMQFIFVLPRVLALLTLAMAVFAVLAWKKGYWTKGGRLHYSLFTAASLGLLWFLFYTGML